jgi:uncharacterized membrane protein
MTDCGTQCKISYQINYLTIMFYFITFLVQESAVLKVLCDDEESKRLAQVVGQEHAK